MYIYSVHYNQPKTFLNKFLKCIYSKGSGSLKHLPIPHIHAYKGITHPTFK